ncbi:unnamed protein product [Parnassius apollo]|uniref:(apollo) hypothetical protein n=1 Tax=Parnassius apollo TaxID=110799 RepID=A0A8S3XKN5_PARAO|nr:unnamed protein product [Parnassius apollo]
MNSLVVLFSVLALAASKPSHLEGSLTYSVPSPSGYISQSRIDVQTSPSFVARADFAPVSRTFVSGPVPAAVGAAAAYTQESRVDIKSSPAVVKTVETSPVAYSAPIAVTAAVAGPAAFSQQSRVDIKSAPALSAPVAIEGYGATPLVYNAQADVASRVAISAPVASSYQSRVDVKTSPAVVSTIKTAPITATPAASSYQSRVEVKSSPAIIRNFEATPVAYGASFTYPAAFAVAAPASYQSRVEYKSSPTIVKTVATGPIAYGAVAASAAVATPVSISKESRVDIKSSPAIVSAISTAPVLYRTSEYRAPYASYDTRFDAGYGSGIASQTFIRSDNIARGAIVAPAYTTSAIATPAVPLDTPEVAAARAAHFEAKALAEGHRIRKRSAALYGAAPVVSTYSAPLISAYYASPFTYSSPVSWSTPFITNKKMYKLVSLCFVLALAAAKPGYVVPLTYTAVPAVSSVSQYSTSVVHGSSLIAPTVYGTPYVASAVVPVGVHSW